MDKSKALGTEPVFRLLIYYAIPAVIGMLVQVSYNVVNSIFVGQFVGPDGLAAVTLVFPISVLGTACSMLVGVGSCAVISMLLGQEKRDEAQRVLGNAMFLFFVIFLLLFVLIISFGHWFIECADVTPQVSEMACQYMYITMAFAVLPGIAYGLNNIIRVQGNPHVAMATLLVGAILNTILDPIFIYVLGWGVNGAAWATVLSQSVACTWVILFLCSKKSLLKIRLGNIRFRPEIAKPVLKIGLAPFLIQVAACFQGVLLLTQLAKYGVQYDPAHGGDVAIATWGITFRVGMIVFLVIVGIYQGAQPIIGYNYGARQFPRVKAATLQAILIATIWCVCCWAFLQLNTDAVVRVFTKTAMTDMEEYEEIEPSATPSPILQPLSPAEEAAKSRLLVKVAPFALRVSLLMMPLIGFQVLASHYFQAVGKPGISIFLSLSRQVTILIPAIWIFPILWGITGIWYAFAFSDFIAAVITWVFLRRELRILDDLAAGKATAAILEQLPDTTSMDYPPPTETDYF